MRFEEVLPALREWKKVRRKGWPATDTLVEDIADGAVGMGDLLADDWEIVEERPEPKSAGEALFVAQGGSAYTWLELTKCVRDSREEFAQAVIAWHERQKASDDSPPFRPKALDEFEARGFERHNRQEAPQEPGVLVMPDSVVEAETVAAIVAWLREFGETNRLVAQLASAIERGEWRKERER